MLCLTQLTPSVLPEALALFALLLETEVELDIVSYGAAINACARGNQWYQALLLLAASGHQKVKM